VTASPAVAAVPHRHGGWTVRCCFCGRDHLHSGLGARISHCADPALRKSYVLHDPTRPAPRRRATTKKEF
jgi:hypothetical protein